MAERSRWRITLQVETLTDFHTLGPGRTLPFLDRPIQLDYRGHPIIPGSLVRGRVRTYLERLLRVKGKPVCRPPMPQNMCPHNQEVTEKLATIGECYCLACRIFGSAWRESEVVFSDFHLDGELEGLSTRTGVGISRTLGTVQAERLFSTETAPFGLRFVGRAEGWLSREEAGWLVAAIKLVTHLGGDKSRGLGEVKIALVQAERWDPKEEKWVEESPQDLIEEAIGDAKD
ncbi:MAG TPA: hypothetical protein EYP09_01335 [Anaerolineae bacterium]|nr:hypothetical protein [Anaerolineae bacterium]